jgi:hypothetical protein
MNEPIKITDLATLKREKQRLKVYCDFQEERIKDRFISIKANYKQIIGEEFLPFSADLNTKVSSALDWINELVLGKLLKINPEGKGKVSGALIKLAEVLAVRLFSNFFKKEK